MCSICSGQVRDTGFAAALRIDKNIIKEHTYTDKRTEQNSSKASAAAIAIARKKAIFIHKIVR